jgi:probable phosphoglycerate mutase
VELGERGQAQARAAGEWFAPLAPTAVISSAMRRAIQTASPIAEVCQVPHSIIPELHERRIGLLSGTPFTLSEGPWVETLKAWTAGDIHYTTPGAESFVDLQERLLPAFRQIAQSHNGGRVVVVAHGIVCKVILLSLLEGYGPSAWHRLGKVENLSTSCLVTQDSGTSWTAERILHIPEPVQHVNRHTTGPRSVA